MADECGKETNHATLAGRIVSGNKIGESSSELVSGIDETKDNEIENLFKEIIDKISVSENNGENNAINTIHNIRANLGVIYSSLIIANLGFNETWKCYKNTTNYNFADHSNLLGDFLSRKMQVVTVEPIHWDEGIFLSHLYVKVSEYNSQLRKWEMPGNKAYECVAFRKPNTNNGTNTETAGCENFKSIEQSYLQKVKEYIKAGRSSFLHGIHLKRNAPARGGSQPSCTPHKLTSYVHISKPAQADIPDVDVDSSASENPSYRKDVVVPVFYDIDKNEDNKKSTADNLAVEHMAVGHETTYEHGGSGISSIVQIYIVFSREGKLHSELYYAINDLLQNLAIVAAGDALIKQQIALEKQAQMLNLLQAPLHRLTAALRDTDESAQRLRAVLYDPSSSIFAAAHGVHRYFEDKRKVHFAGFSWIALHKWNDSPPESEKKDKDQRLSLTVLAIIAHIFSIEFNEERGSDEGESPSAALKLWERVNDRLYPDPDSKVLAAEEDLRKTCKEILFTCFNDSKCKKDEGLLWFGLRDSVVGIRCFDDILRDHWIGVVSRRLKLLLLEPYKFDSKYESILPLALILYERNSECILCIDSRNQPPKKQEFKSFEEVLEKERALEEEGIGKLFLNCRLPCPKAIYLWTLILRLAALKTPTSANCIINNENQGSSSTEINIQFDGDVFEDDKFVNFMKRLEPLITWEKEGGYAPGGDSTLPWFDFALSCKADKRQAPANNNSKDAFYSDSHEVFFRDNAFRIMCDGTEFSISSPDREPGTTALVFKACNKKKEEISNGS